MRVHARPVLDHGVPHPGPPAEPVVARGLHHDVALDAADPPQRVGHHGRLEPALLDDVGVLEVTATAQARTGVRARWLDPVWRRREHLYRVRVQILAGLRGHPGMHQLARKCVTYEDDLALVPRDAVPAVGHWAYFQLQYRPDNAVVRHRSPELLRAPRRTWPATRSSRS